MEILMLGLAAFEFEKKTKKMKRCKLEWIKCTILTMKAERGRLITEFIKRFPAEALPRFTGSWKVRFEEGAQVLVEDESKCCG